MPPSTSRRRLADKHCIIQNAIDLAHILGIANPRVAILAAVETINPAMQATLDAAALCKMAERGQITGGMLDGPLAFDNAISAAAAAQKDIISPVAGLADILVVPNIEAGNILAKQLTFLANADAAGIVLGAAVPIILTSRADDARTRLASCALAARWRRGQPSRMDDAILTVNAGSSSIKFALFCGGLPDLPRIASGEIENIGAAPHLKIRTGQETASERRWPHGEALSHEDAVRHHSALDRKASRPGSARRRGPSHRAWWHAVHGSRPAGCRHADQPSETERFGPAARAA